MRQFFAYGLVALLAGAFFALAEMPARQVIAFAGDTGPVSFSGHHGTLWEGGARTVRVNGRQVGGLRWRWRPWRLPLGTIALRLDSAHADLGLAGRLDIPFTGGPPDLADTRLMMRADLTNLPLTGRLVAEGISLAWSDAGPRLRGRLAWREAGSLLLPGIDLGDVAATADGGSRAAIATRDGVPADARVTGSVEMQASSLSYRLDISGATPQGREALAGLSGVGKALPDGAVRLEGEWRFVQ